MSIMKDWEAKTIELAELFTETYFDVYDFEWSDNVVGGVLNVEDQLWNMGDIATALKQNVWQCDVFQYYNDHVSGTGEKLNLHQFISRLRNGEIRRK